MLRRSHPHSGLAYLPYSLLHNKQPATRLCAKLAQILDDEALAAFSGYSEQRALRRAFARFRIPQ